MQGCCSSCSSWTARAPTPPRTVRNSDPDHRVGDGAPGDAPLAGGHPRQVISPGDAPVAGGQANLEDSLNDANPGDVLDEDGDKLFWGMALLDLAKISSLRRR